MFLLVVVFIARRMIRSKRKKNAKLAKLAKIDQEEHKNKEDYADTYSIPLQADALNRMARWNASHSRQTSTLNYKLPPNEENNCY